MRLALTAIFFFCVAGATVSAGEEAPAPTEFRWLIGNWSCDLSILTLAISQDDMQMALTFTADAATMSLIENAHSAFYDAQGVLGYDRKLARWNERVTSTMGGIETMTATGPYADKMAFVGVSKNGKRTVHIREMLSHQSDGTFSLLDQFEAGGEWQTADSTRCQRS